jgi:hypothetical protein
MFFGFYFRGQTRFFVPPWPKFPAAAGAGVDTRAAMG